MKNLNKIALLVVSVLVFSSCGSISISQKRYSRGLNIDLFVQKDNQKQDKKEGVRIKPAAPVASVDNIKSEAELLSVQAEAVSNVPETLNTASEQMLAANTSGVQLKFAVAGKAKRTGKAGVFSGIKTLKSMARPKSIRKAASVSHADATHSDVGTLLLVIIAILLPPLAVFLYFGEFETHFIISLLLVLLAGGIFLGGGSAFWWTLAVVHALLVVLGMLG